MRWSWKIATIANVDVYVHMTFAVLVVWIALGYWQLEGTVIAVVSGVSFILALFFCVLLHEFGHALTAQRFGIQTKNIMLLPIGGIASIEKNPDKPSEEIMIALAGPAVSFAIALLLWIILSVSGGMAKIDYWTVTGGAFLQRLMFINLILAGFNLLPALPMDGGRVFRATLSLHLGPEKATRIAARVAQGLALIFALVGLQYNLFLVFIAVFIWMGSLSEAAMASVKSALKGAQAEKAMLTNYEVLQLDDSLDRAAELTLSGSQKDFPVMSAGKVVGVLRQPHLLSGLQEHGKLGRVDQVMKKDFSTAEIGESLEQAMGKIQQTDSGLLIVTKNGQFAGMIDMDNIKELISIQKALQQHDNQSW